MDCYVNRRNKRTFTETLNNNNFLSTDNTIVQDMAKAAVKRSEPNIEKEHDQQKNFCNKNVPFRFVPLEMSEDGKTHMVSAESKRLIDEEVSLNDLEKMTSLFYEKVLDPTLDQFIRSHGDPHATRFAKWIHQTLSGSTVWDEERSQRSKEPVELAEGVQAVVHDLATAHTAARHSPKRPPEDVGKPFKLDESRVWMRLHFWALRESGVMEKSPSFADYYVRFIAHFVGIYEPSSPIFTRESLRWSAESKNLQSYLANGRRMVDVIGLSLKEATHQLPRDEANDTAYPYNRRPL